MWLALVLCVGLVSASEVEMATSFVRMVFAEDSPSVTIVPLDSLAGGSGAYTVSWEYAVEKSSSSGQVRSASTYLLEAL
jgi:hypothetical protein